MPRRKNAGPIERVEKTVFLSYRRSNVPWALAIYQNLTHHGYDVFFDYEGIGSGDFEQIILGNIRARAHFLVLLTPSALERIREPGDWLRREIETALETRRNIVPLMLEGFDFGSPAIAERLEGTLEPLKQYNGIPIVASYFEEGMDRLRRKHLSVVLSAVPHPASSAVIAAARQQQSVASNAPTVREQTLTAEQWYELGYDAKDPTEKIRYYTEAIRLNPKHALAHTHRADARILLGDLDGAAADFDEAIRLEPDEDYFVWNRAHGRLLMKDFQGALADSDEAIRMEPARLNHTLRGHVQIEMGDVVGAIESFTAALTSEGAGEVLALMGRAKAYTIAGDFDSALMDYDQIIRLEPSSATAWLGRARTQMAKADFSAAAQDFAEAARRSTGDSSHIHLERAVALTRANDFVGARDTIQQLLSADSVSTELRSALEGALTGLSKKLRSS